MDANLERVKAVLKVLPNVHSVWITDDGSHHIHPHYGGQEYKREDVEKLEEEAPKKKRKEDSK